MRQLEVQIMGQSYLLTCPEDGEVRLREAVAKVDEAMCGIRDLGKVKARDRIAVLAALNLTFELMQALAARPVVTPAQEIAPAPQASQKPLNTAHPAPQQGAPAAKAPAATSTPAASQAPQRPSQPPPQPQGRTEEAGGKAPHPQLQTLLQRLNTALGTNGRPD